MVSEDSKNRDAFFSVHFLNKKSDTSHSFFFEMFALAHTEDDFLENKKVLLFVRFQRMTIKKRDDFLHEIIDRTDAISIERFSMIVRSVVHENFSAFEVP